MHYLIYICKKFVFFTLINEKEKKNLLKKKKEKFINFVGDRYGLYCKKFVFRTAFEAPVKISASVRNAYHMHCYT